MSSPASVAVKGPSVASTSNSASRTGCVRARMTLGSVSTRGSGRSLVTGCGDSDIPREYSIERVLSRLTSRKPSIDAGVSVVALEGTVFPKPGDHSSGQVHGVKTFFLKERGGAQRATPGTTGADNESIAGKLIKMVGQFGQGNKGRHGCVAGVPLVLLAYVDEDRVAFQQLAHFAGADFS